MDFIDEPPRGMESCEFFVMGCCLPPFYIDCIFSIDEWWRDGCRELNYPPLTFLKNVCPPQNINKREKKEVPVLVFFFVPHLPGGAFVILSSSIV